MSRMQAKDSAANYLRVSPFSRNGLIAQLQFDGFSSQDATFAVDSQNADWLVVAARRAALYMITPSFSRSGLIGQLVFDGFTQSQAEHGANSVGL